MDHWKHGTRQTGGSRFGGELTSEARKEGREPFMNRRVPCGRCEAAPDRNAGRTCDAGH
jgi:hypothetical protein